MVKKKVPPIVFIGGKKPKKDWINLAGGLFLNWKTGEIEMRSGKDNWFTHKIRGNVKGTKAYETVMATYGTKVGQSARAALAKAIMRSIKVGKIGGK